MNIVINKDLLVHAVQHVSKAVSPRTVMPILSGIKFEADHSGLTLIASDADISISYHIPKIHKEKEVISLISSGSIVLPARFFLDIVRKLPGETVTIHVLEHFLTSIVSGQAEFNLHGMAGNDFPRLPQIEEDSSITISSALLKSIIRRTAFAVSHTETRPILTGIQWSLEDDNLTFTATDSHRLARGRIKIDQSNRADFPTVVVPGRSLNELNKILDDQSEDVEIVISGNQLLLRAENLLFYSRLLEGNYPDTSRIIPTNSKTNITMNTKVLLDALERAALVATKERNNVVRLNSISDQEIEIYSFTPEIGKLSEEVNIIKLDGEELKISFNVIYMLDALKVIDSTEVELAFNGGMSPFIIRPVGQEGTLHLIVPVRTY